MCGICTDCQVCLTKTFLSEPTAAQRCRSETEKSILEDLFRSALSQFKRMSHSGNVTLDVTFHYFGIF